LTGNQSVAGIKTFTSGVSAELLWIKEGAGFANPAGYAQLATDITYFHFNNSNNTAFARFLYGSGQRIYTLPNSDGTLALTSNLASYLPLSGGTLTGALSGTSATFTTGVSSTNGYGFTSSLGSENITFSNSWFGGIDAIYQNSGNNNDFGIYLNGGTSTQAKFYITNAGNVGINTTSPTNGKLEIQQSATTAGLWVQTGGTNSSHVIADFRTGTNLSALQILGNGVSSFGGNVGIGTTSPANPISFIRLLNISGGDAALVLSNSNGTAKNWSIGALDSGSLGIYDGSNPRMIVNSSGNVGIGTTAPSQKLDVVGQITYGDGTNYGRIGAIGGETFLASDTGGNNINFYTKPSGGSLTERMRITSDGVLQFSTTSVVPTTNNIIHSYGANGYMYIQGGTTGLALAGSGNRNNAIYVNSSSNIITFVADNAERMRITSGGNVGIGTTAPGDSRLMVSGTHPSGNAILRVQAVTDDTASIGLFGTAQTRKAMLYYSASQVVLETASDPLIFGTNGTERMRITSGGYLKASNNGTYVNSTGSYHEMRTNVNLNQVVTFHSSASTPYGIHITYSGASPNTTDNEFIFCGDPSNSRFIVWSNGSVINRTGVYGTFSDVRFKENIVDATPKLGDLAKLKVRNFNLKGDSTKLIGFIAQEFEEVFPNMVDVSTERGTDGETYKSIKTSILVPMLVKAVQELKAELDTLKNK